MTGGVLLEVLLRFLVVCAVMAIFIASQLFWFRRVGELGARFISSEKWRRALRAAGTVVFLFLFAYNFAWVQRAPEPTTLTLTAALLQAPFRWWMVSSLLGFGFVVIFWVADRLVRSLRWCYRAIAGAAATMTRKGELQPAADPPADPPSPSRRRFLEQAAIAVSATPFAAAGYGLLFGRTDLEITNQRIRLPRLPKAFHSFRLAQLSDIHIGPFMTAEDVRRYVGVTNQLKPDAVALTGDFITWDPATQAAVVEALSGLKAPFGVFGCLGNHEAWYEVEDSITRMFAARGIRILRREREVLETSGERLNLIGVDFQTRRPMGPPGARFVGHYLEGVDRLMLPDTANILLSHNPNTFDRAAELGIDLSLAGHTHGGQVTLEFIHPSLSPSRLITDYVRGWFQKGSSQLYVNSGIGTMFAPIRVGSPPEITVVELVREG